MWSSLQFFRFLFVSLNIIFCNRTLEEKSYFLTPNTLSLNLKLHFHLLYIIILGATAHSGPKPAHRGDQSSSQLKSDMGQHVNPPPPGCCWLSRPDYPYKSVATQIPHDTELAPVCQLECCMRGSSKQVII